MSFKSKSHTTTTLIPTGRDVRHSPVPFITSGQSRWLSITTKALPPLMHSYPYLLPVPFITDTGWPLVMNKTKRGYGKTVTLTFYNDTGTPPTDALVPVPPACSIPYKGWPLVMNKTERGYGKTVPAGFL